jgi:hypothetical protein
MVAAAPFFHRLQLERDNNAVNISTAGPGRDFHAFPPARCICTHSTSTLSVSAQAMDNYTTEATELVETYGLSQLSSVTSELNNPLQTSS